MSWKCKQCGKCCQFIIIPLAKAPDMETDEYLASHGIVYENGKLYVPAKCQYLKENKCAIHSDKFSNCRIAGEKECKEAQKGYEILKKARKKSTEAH